MQIPLALIKPLTHPPAVPQSPLSSYKTWGTGKQGGGQLSSTPAHLNLDAAT